MFDQHQQIVFRMVQTQRQRPPIKPKIKKHKTVGIAIKEKNSALPEIESYLRLYFPFMKPHIFRANAEHDMSQQFENFIQENKPNFFIVDEHTTNLLFPSNFDFLNFLNEYKKPVMYLADADTSLPEESIYLSIMYTDSLNEDCVIRFLNLKEVC